MTIEEIIFSTPIPRDKKFLNSVVFLHILSAKHSGLHSLIMESNNLNTLTPILDELESLENVISSSANLIFLRYLIGTKYIEIGLKFENNEYLVKGILMMDKIHEDDLHGIDLKAEYYRLFYRAILIHFNNELKLNPNYQYSFKNVEPLLKSKYFLFKFYNLLIEKKIKPKALIEARVISDLISVLIFLSRWNEPFFILDKRTIIYDDSPAFFNYLKAHILNEMTFHTCCSIYPAMTFEIKRFIKAATNIKEINDHWRTDLLKINEEVDETIKSNTINLEEFERDYGDTKKDIDEHEPYRKWVLKNHFSLCEHALYCFCGLSKSDNLTIKSDHKHTQIYWVEGFEILLNKLKGEYNLARYFLYLSKNETLIGYNRNDELPMSESNGLLNSSESDFLIQSFKSAYSILDKIARGIDAALDINHKGNIYFHDCWNRVKLKCPKSTSRYLYALYSIGLDLAPGDVGEYSAFKEYRKWRNWIEHEYLFLSSDSIPLKEINATYPVIKEIIEIDEFREKTEYFLQLCRSAIFSFVFFIRHESKHKEKAESQKRMSDKY